MGLRGGVSPLEVSRAVGSIGISVNNRKMSMTWMRQGVKERNSGKGGDSTNIPHRHSINCSSTPHGTCNQLVVSLYHEMRKVRSPYPIRVVDQASNLVEALVLGTYIWWCVQSITADGQQGL